MLTNCGVGEDSWKSLGLQGNQIFDPEINKSTLNIYWKGCCWSWSSATLATWCEEPTHWKHPDAGKDWRQKEKRAAEDEMVRGGHWLNGHDFAKSRTRLNDWAITPPLILSLRDKILSPSLPFFFPNRVERITSTWLKYEMLLKVTEGIMDARWTPEENHFLWKK